MRHAIVHSCALTLAALSTTPLAADVIHVDLNAFESGSSVSTLNNQTAGGGQWWNPSNGSVSARYQSGLGRTGGTALVIGNLRPVGDEQFLDWPDAGSVSEGGAGRFWHDCGW